MEIVLVAALARNRVIGRDGSLPWHLPDDLRRFKALTLDGVVVMGRKTFASIGRPLPRRTSLVLSRSASSIPGCAAPACAVVSGLDEALAHAQPHDQLFVIGGGEIYALFLPIATRLELTHVEAELEGDAHFPELDPTSFRLVREELHPADARHAHAFRFSTYLRR